MKICHITLVTWLFAILPSVFSNDILQNSLQIDSSLVDFGQDCQQEINSLCKNVNASQTFFSILNCLSQFASLENELSDKCQHKIWSFKYKISSSNFVEEATKTVCKSMLSSNQDCAQTQQGLDSDSGASVLSCLLDRIQPDTSLECSKYLKQMELIVFSDYRLIHKFATVCREQIEHFKCGRLSDNYENTLSSQTKTVECLQSHIDDLPGECSHEILRISELQSNDFHLNKPLFFACRYDREKFCKNIDSGNGRVYNCLMKHRNDEMSEECRDMLSQQERLTVHDYKVSKSMVRACKGDIRKYQCRHNTSEHKEIRLAQILLCLENAYSKNLEISKDCYSEMLVHRKSLIEEYKLTPSLVAACHDDIEKFCNPIGHGSQTLHCLMKHASSKRYHNKNQEQITSKCQREVEQLLKEVNIGENWQVDVVFQESCQSTVDALCAKIKPGGGRVLNCLADHINSDQMDDKCSEVLHQIQYFVVRDFEIDSRLYDSCYNDAHHLCHAKKDWYDNPERMDPERGPSVLACLYRHAYHKDESVRLTRRCEHQIRRAMKARATSVNLIPMIEEPCVRDLAKHCSSDEELIEQKGYEMKCLQTQYDKLETMCQEAIGNFTADQSTHFELNYDLNRECTALAKEICSQEYENSMNDDQGDVIQCLIRFKNDYRVRSHAKCRDAIERFQMLNIKNYKFDIRLQDACHKEIDNFCGMFKTKYDVLNCLSSVLYEDEINSSRISYSCHKVLSDELLQFNENIDFDPRFAGACKSDIEKFCTDVEKGQSHVIECLKNSLIHLTRACQRKLFHNQYIELQDSSIDYPLLSNCKSTIDKYCASSDLQDVLYCLRDHRNEIGVAQNCRSLIVKRILVQNKDYRLNPRLKNGCKKEIHKHCSSILIGSNSNELLDGKIIACLKKQYLLNTLSQVCEAEIVNIIREVSANVELDPILFKSCHKEITNQCSEDIDIHECLKSKFLSKKISNIACKREIARIIRESASDIQSDTHLHSVCLQDLKTFCFDVIPGRGQQLNCLTTLHRISAHKLTPECDTLLSKRLELFDSAAEIYKADTVLDVYHIVADSPQHNHLFSFLLVIVLIIFIFGLVFGRVTKYTLLANEKVK